MTTTRHRSRIGPKGQVVVAKELRRKHGLKEGGLVEQVSTEQGVLLVPLQTEKLLDELDNAAKEIAETWPRKVSAVQAIRQDRERP
ncbi:MAG: AbrB/MazE/SpoVT family DNA-binding domain-containing protein [Thaumarchaeota archaeon]|nr:AbrB/MazE/SpoVT family DNA-binding domain-containing protein [Nitrososphaerota archaeon]